MGELVPFNDASRWSRWWTACATLGALTLWGCGSEPDADLPESAHVWMWEFVPWSNASFITWVVIIDDVDDAEGRLLRANIKDAFSAYVHDLLDNRTREGHDPDRWYAVDLRMVVVHPSVEGWIGPDEDPALRWTTSDANEAGAIAFAAAFARAVDAVVAPAGSSYRLLDVYHRVGLLVTECGLPRDGAEARLVEAVADKYPWIRLLVATTRDDASPDPPDAYRLGVASECDGISRTETHTYVPVPPTENEELCTSRIGASWRLARWNDFLVADSPTRCSDLTALSEQFDGGLISDIRPTCLSRPIAVASNGLASCTLEVTHRDGDCSAARGWFDPPDAGGAAVNVDRPGDAWPLCEVRQLDGEAGAVCRSGADCANCPSGFCRTDESRPICQEGTFPPQLRFIGGVFSGPPLRARIRCLLD